MPHKNCKKKVKKRIKYKKRKSTLPYKTIRVGIPIRTESGEISGPYITLTYANEIVFRH